MIHKTIPVGPLQCNCILLACEETREAVLIDPGDEAPRILKLIGDNNATVKYILHTHAHFDHVGATSDVRAKLPGLTCLHQADDLLYKNLPLQGRLFGITLSAPPPIEKYLEDDEELVFGKHRLQVLHTPGHSPGSICFKLLDGTEDLFSGDTLFQSSIGRTDLLGGDYDRIMRSIKERILVLDDATKVHPGHGPSTKIWEEKKQNPFLR